jgi:hypothetical protein
MQVAESLDRGVQLCSEIVDLAELLLAPLNQCSQQSGIGLSPENGQAAIGGLELRYASPQLTEQPACPAVQFKKIILDERAKSQNSQHVLQPNHRNTRVIHVFAL